MSRGQVRKGYLRRQKDRQLEREKAAERKRKKREVKRMGKATEGYKAARLSHVQELQTCLTEKTEDLRVAEMSLEKYWKAWNAEKDLNKATNLLWTGEKATLDKRLVFWQRLAGFHAG